MRKVYYKKIISGLLVFLMAVNAMPVSLAFARTEIPAAHPAFHLEIPAELGSVQEISAGGGPSILQIQTAHGSFEAQKKIQALLHLLKDRYGIKLLLLEGSASKLYPELMDFFPGRADLNMKVAEMLAHEALVKGDELFLLEERGASAYGIEDVEIYRRAREAFKKVLLEKQASEKFLQDLNLQLERLAASYLSQELRDFLKIQENHEKEIISFSAWLREIKKYAQKTLQIDLSSPVNQFDWPMLVRAVKIEEFESENSHEKGRIILQNEIKPDLFLNELEKITALIADKLARTENEKVWSRIFKKCALLQRLLNLELDSSDYEILKKDIESFRPAFLAREFKRINRGKRVKDSEFRNLRKIRPLFDTAVKFYAGTEERDQAMLKNIQKRMKETGEQKAVVITGGFHGKAFKDFFTSRGFNYALISPKLTSAEGREEYLRAVLGSAPEISKSTMDLPRAMEAADVRLAMGETGYLESRINWTVTKVRSELRVADGEKPEPEPEPERDTPQEVEWNPVSGAGRYQRLSAISRLWRNGQINKYGLLKYLVVEYYKDVPGMSNFIVRLMEIYIHGEKEINSFNEAAGELIAAYMIEERMRKLGYKIKVAVINPLLGGREFDLIFHIKPTGEAVKIGGLPFEEGFYTMEGKEKNGSMHDLEEMVTSVVNGQASAQAETLMLVKKTGVPIKGVFVVVGGKTSSFREFKIEKPAKKIRADIPIFSLMTQPLNVENASAPGNREIKPPSAKQLAAWYSQKLTLTELYEIFNRKVVSGVLEGGPAEQAAYAELLKIAKVNSEKARIKKEQRRKTGRDFHEEYRLREEEADRWVALLMETVADGAWAGEVLDWYFLRGSDFTRPLEELTADLENVRAGGGDLAAVWQFLQDQFNQRVPKLKPQKPEPEKKKPAPKPQSTKTLPQVQAAGVRARFEKSLFHPQAGWIVAFAAKPYEEIGEAEIERIQASLTAYFQPALDADDLQLYRQLDRQLLLWLHSTDRVAAWAALLAEIEKRKQPPAGERSESRSQIIFDENLKPLSALTWELEDAEHVQSYFRALLAEYNFPSAKKVFRDGLEMQNGDGQIDFVPKPVTSENLKIFSTSQDQTKDFNPEELYQWVRLKLSEAEDRISEEIRSFYVFFGIQPNAAKWFSNEYVFNPEKGLLKLIRKRYERKKQREFKILVQAAWNGEDAYSLAILLKELFPEADFKIFANDMQMPNPENLSWIPYSGMPLMIGDKRREEILEKYFDSRVNWEGLNVYSLKKEHLALVQSFTEGNVTDIKSFGEGPYDAILALRLLGARRYVTKEEDMRLALDHSWNKLKPRGLLVLGNEEALIDMGDFLRKKFKVLNRWGGLFYKPARAELRVNSAIDQVTAQETDYSILGPEVAEAFREINKGQPLPVLNIQGFSPESILQFQEWAAAQPPDSLGVLIMSGKGSGEKNEKLISRNYLYIDTIQNLKIITDLTLSSTWFGEKRAAAPNGLEFTYSVYRRPDERFHIHREYLALRKDLRSQKLSVAFTRNWKNRLIGNGFEGSSISSVDWSNPRGGAGPVSRLMRGIFSARGVPSEYETMLLELGIIRSLEELNDPGVPFLFGQVEKKSEQRTFPSLLNDRTRQRWLAMDYLGTVMPMFEGSYGLPDDSFYRIRDFTGKQIAAYHGSNFDAITDALDMVGLGPEDNYWTLGVGTGRDLLAANLYGARRAEGEEFDETIFRVAQKLIFPGKGKNVFTGMPSDMKALFDVSKIKISQADWFNDGILSEEGVKRLKDYDVFFYYAHGSVRQNEMAKKLAEHMDDRAVLIVYHGSSPWNAPKDLAELRTHAWSMGDSFISFLVKPGSPLLEIQEAKYVSELKSKTADVKSLFLAGWKTTGDTLNKLEEFPDVTEVAVYDSEHSVQEILQMARGYFGGIGLGQGSVKSGGPGSWTIRWKDREVNFKWLSTEEAIPAVDAALMNDPKELRMSSRRVDTVTFFLNAVYESLNPGGLLVMEETSSYYFPQEFAWFRKGLIRYEGNLVADKERFSSKRRIYRKAGMFRSELRALKLQPFLTEFDKKVETAAIKLSRFHQSLPPEISEKYKISTTVNEDLAGTTMRNFIRTFWDELTELLGNEPSLWPPPGIDFDEDKPEHKLLMFFATGWHSLSFFGRYASNKEMAGENYVKDFEDEFKLRILETPGRKKQLLMAAPGFLQEAIEALWILDKAGDKTAEIYVLDLGGKNSLGEKFLTNSVYYDHRDIQKAEALGIPVDQYFDLADRGYRLKAGKHQRFRFVLDDLNDAASLDRLARLNLRPDFMFFRQIFQYLNESGKGPLIHFLHSILQEDGVFYSSFPAHHFPFALGRSNAVPSLRLDKFWKRGVVADPAGSETPVRSVIKFHKLTYQIPGENSWPEDPFEDEKAEISEAYGFMALAGFLREFSGKLPERFEGADLEDTVFGWTYYQFSAMREDLKNELLNPDFLDWIAVQEVEKQQKFNEHYTLVYGGRSELRSLNLTRKDQLTIPVLPELNNKKIEIELQNIKKGGPSVQLELIPERGSQVNIKVYVNKQPTGDFWLNIHPDGHYQINLVFPFSETDDIAVENSGVMSTILSWLAWEARAANVDFENTGTQNLKLIYLYHKYFVIAQEYYGIYDHRHVGAISLKKNVWYDGRPRVILESLTGKPNRYKVIQHNQVPDLNPGQAIEITLDEQVFIVDEISGQKKPTQFYLNQAVEKFSFKAAPKDFPKPQGNILRSELRISHKDLKPLSGLTWGVEDAEHVETHFLALLAKYSYPQPKKVFLNGEEMKDANGQVMYVPKPINSQNLYYFSRSQRETRTFWPKELYEWLEQNIALSQIASEYLNSLRPFYNYFGIQPNAARWFGNRGLFEPEEKFIRWIQEKYRNGQKEFRILVHAGWNGEDAYSLAVVLNAMFPEVEFKIFARDLDEPKPENLSWVPYEKMPSIFKKDKSKLNEYFVRRKHEKGKSGLKIYSLKREHLGLVQGFEKGDIRDAVSFSGGPFDVILASRVLGPMRYVREDSDIQAALEHSWNAIVPGGLLVLGDSGAFQPSEFTTLKFEMFDLTAGIFLKPEQRTSSELRVADSPKIDEKAVNYFFEVVRTALKQLPPDFGVYNLNYEFKTVEQVHGELGNFPRVEHVIKIYEDRGFMVNREEQEGDVKKAQYWIDPHSKTFKFSNLLELMKRKTGVQSEIYEELDTNRAIEFLGAETQPVLTLDELKIWVDLESEVQRMDALLGRSKRHLQDQKPALASSRAKRLLTSGMQMRITSSSEPTRTSKRSKRNSTLSNRPGIGAKAFPSTRISPLKSSSIAMISPGVKFPSTIKSSPSKLREVNLASRMERVNGLNRSFYKNVQKKHNFSSNLRSELRTPWEATGGLLNKTQLADQIQGLQDSWMLSRWRVIASLAALPEPEWQELRKTLVLRGLSEITLNANRDYGTSLEYASVMELQDDPDLRVFIQNMPVFSSFKRMADQKWTTQNDKLWTDMLKVAQKHYVAAHGTRGNYLGSMMDGEWGRFMRPLQLHYALIGIMLDGQVTYGDAAHLREGVQDVASNAADYGPYYVIFQPGYRDIRWFDSYIGFQIFGGIPSERQDHRVYLVPVEESRQFFVKALDKAVKFGFLDVETAEAEKNKILTYAEWIQLDNQIPEILKGEKSPRSFLSRAELRADQETLQFPLYLEPDVLAALQSPDIKSKVHLINLTSTGFSNLFRFWLPVGGKKVHLLLKRPRSMPTEAEQIALDRLNRNEVEIMTDIVTSPDFPKPGEKMQIHGRKWQHPNVRLGVWNKSLEGLVFPYMDPLNGATDAEDVFITRSTSLSVTHYLAMALQMAGALGFLHHMGIVHHDIKPANFFAYQNGVVLTDFNLAYNMNGSREMLRGGTPLYAPREQWEGAPADYKHDVYALGMTLLRIWLGGQHDSQTSKFSSLPADEIAQQVNFRDCPLRKVIEKALGPNPYASAIEMEAAIRSARDKFIKQAARPSSEPEPETAEEELVISPGQRVVPKVPAKLGTIGETGENNAPVVRIPQKWDDEEAIIKMVTAIDPELEFIGIEGKGPTGVIYLVKDKKKNQTVFLKIPIGQDYWAQNGLPNPGSSVRGRVINKSAHQLFEDIRIGFLAQDTGFVPKPVGFYHVKLLDSDGEIYPSYALKMEPVTGQSLEDYINEGSAENMQDFGKQFTQMILSFRMLRISLQGLNQSDKVALQVGNLRITFGDGKLMLVGLGELTDEEGGSIIDIHNLGVLPQMILQAIHRIFATAPGKKKIVPDDRLLLAGIQEAITEFRVNDTAEDLTPPALPTGEQHSELRTEPGVFTKPVLKDWGKAKIKLRNIKKDIQPDAPDVILEISPLAQDWKIEVYVKDEKGHFALHNEGTHFKINWVFPFGGKTSPYENQGVMSTILNWLAWEAKQRGIGIKGEKTQNIKLLHLYDTYFSEYDDGYEVYDRRNISPLYLRRAGSESLVFSELESVPGRPGHYKIYIDPENPAALQSGQIVRITNTGQILLENETVTKYFLEKAGNAVAAKGSPKNFVPPKGEDLSHELVSSELRAAPEMKDLKDRGYIFPPDAEAKYGREPLLEILAKSGFAAAGGFDEEQIPDARKFLGVPGRSEIRDAFVLGADLALNEGGLVLLETVLKDSDAAVVADSLEALEQLENYNKERQAKGQKPVPVVENLDQAKARFTGSNFYGFASPDETSSEWARILKLEDNLKIMTARRLEVFAETFGVSKLLESFKDRFAFEKSA